MKILIVGFGGIGCRHAQSLVSESAVNEIWIMEKEEAIFKKNCLAISQKLSRFEYIRDDFDKLPEHIDFAIIATTSFQRFEIFKHLVTIKNIKLFLLEKVVFQSIQQFEEAISMSNIFGVRAYCNFVNRYFPNYKRIQKGLLQNKRFKMFVSGGDFGLGCNGLHYIDLFHFLAQSNPILIQHRLIENLKKHKRGSNFREVIGSMRWETQREDLLILSSDSNRDVNVEILITQDDQMHILNEGSGLHLSSESSNEIIQEDFQILRTSFLTSKILIDIINNCCQLPLIEETFHSHEQLFRCVNSTLGLSINENSPIT